MTGELSEDERKQIGGIVETVRNAKGLSKEAAAREAGISSITWKRVEDGLRVQGAKLAQVLKVVGVEGTTIGMRRFSASETGLAIDAPRPDEMRASFAAGLHDLRARIADATDEMGATMERLAAQCQQLIGEYTRLATEIDPLPPGVTRDDDLATDVDDVALIREPQPRPADDPRG